MRPAVRLSAVALAAGLLFAPTVASTWGAAGHRMIGVLAVQALPEEVPSFVRGPRAAEEMGELAREPDRSKGSGRIHGTNRDAAHFVDIDDEGKVLGGPMFTDLKPTRADYEKALQAAGTDSWKAGYLQYAVIDGYQQLVRDFGYWRVAKAGEKASRGARRAWYKRDRIRREKLLFASLGDLAHYVGDGAQPLHTSVHYNGWSIQPNPRGFTAEKIHRPFEGDFVKGAVSAEMARAAMVPFADCACPIEKRVLGYIGRTNTFVVPLYRMWGEGAFRPGQAKGAEFAAERFGAGASELRDLIVLAWRDSATTKVGWPVISVADVEAGKVDPYEFAGRRRLMLQFGVPTPGKTHRPRPAAFGIAAREGQIALVRIRPTAGGDWLDLPGGALDPGEDEVAALVREFGEETGLVIAVGEPVTAFAQYFEKSDGQAVNNQGHVYIVTVAREDAALKIEDDHTLVWLDPAEAVRTLRHDGHAWAVAKWMRGRGQ